MIANTSANSMLTSTTCIRSRQLLASQSHGCSNSAAHMVSMYTRTEVPTVSQAIAPTRPNQPKCP
jgi:hypothetical protein